MRHRLASRHFGRTPKHRRALMRNLCTQLIIHDRITTTLQKAKEMRPFVERLIHSAKRDTPQSQIFLKSYLFQNDAIKKLREEIAPRFKDLPAGFTRVSYLGNRHYDKGDAAMIEILGNPYTEYEKNEELVEIESRGLKTVWEWEMGLLEQENKYYEDLLRQLKMTVEQ